MGLERHLFKRKNGDIKSDNSDKGAPEPLPMPEIEAPDRPKKLSDRRLNVKTCADKNDRTIGVILGRRNIDSAIPSDDSALDTRDDSHWARCKEIFDRPLEPPLSLDYWSKTYDGYLGLSDRR